MRHWQKWIAGWALLFIAVACSPAGAVETAEPTKERPSTDALAPAPNETVEEVDHVEVTKEFVTPTPEPEEDEMTPTPEPNSSSLGGSTGNVFVETAVTDLAQRLNVTEEEIQVVSFELVVWPDASMGCPHPDMMYAQVLKEGYKIVLEHNGKTYNYHGGERRDPFLCEKPYTDKNIIPPPNMDE